ncbi:transporter substrate-binding domain-containing protein [Selenomonas sp.]|uniref:transporter substrate-binding domain-containing protein n=1 Tax=Selenomonas sp. TaxID=2053611 RepID=UPI0025FD692C|nr:transporter substrate-binding domain-containing protein [Selenomonas sp.]MCI6284295.1 transporter substrate-binding domain-containing protein [Selenomonas sp.]
MTRDGKLRLTFFAAATALAACLWTGAAEAAGRPVLRVGLTYIAQDEASGTGPPQFDKTVTDYMQVLASYAGMDVQYVPGSVQGNIDALLDGRVDVLPDLVITPERAALMDFSAFPTGFLSSTLYLHGGVQAFDTPACRSASARCARATRAPCSTRCSRWSSVRTRSRSTARRWRSRMRIARGRSTASRSTRGRSGRKSRRRLTM